MMGGDWYAMTEGQLQRVLDGDLDWQQFLYDELPEKPRECFSDAEAQWNDLRELLDAEGVCGDEIAEDIPEATSYATAEDVPDIAQALAELTDEELLERFDDLSLEAELDELLPLVRSLAAFYKRAAEHGDAVLFRVT